MFGLVTQSPNELPINNNSLYQNKISSKFLAMVMKIGKRLPFELPFFFGSKPIDFPSKMVPCRFSLALLLFFDFLGLWIDGWMDEWEPSKSKKYSHLPTTLMEFLAPH
jgi:hypothetical protein